MELNILIEGDRPEAYPAAVRFANRISDHRLYEIDLNAKGTSDRIKQALDRQVRKPDVIVFDNIASQAALFMCVELVKLYRAEVPFTVSAVFVCNNGVIVLSNRVPIVVNGDPTEDQVAALRKALEEDGPSHNVVYAADEPKIEFLGPGEPIDDEPVDLGFKILEKVEDPPRKYVTWDEGGQSFTAACLCMGDEVIESATEVHVYDNGKQRFTFEKAPGKRHNIVRGEARYNVSGVEGLDTHYFETGNDLTQSLNQRYVRPATPTELSDYLNAKYSYNVKS